MSCRVVLQTRQRRIQRSRKQSWWPPRAAAYHSIYRKMQKQQQQQQQHYCLQQSLSSTSSIAIATSGCCEILFLPTFVGCNYSTAGWLYNNGYSSNGQNNKTPIASLYRNKKVHFSNYNNYYNDLNYCPPHMRTGVSTITTAAATTNNSMVNQIQQIPFLYIHIPIIQFPPNNMGYKYR